MASGLSEQGDEAQVNTLIYAMGDEGDDILCSFAISADDRKVYETVKGKFDEHFVPRRNVIFERAKFNMRRQEEGESRRHLHHGSVLTRGTLRLRGTPQRDGPGPHRGGHPQQSAVGEDAARRETHAGQCRHASPPVRGRKAAAGRAAWQQLFRAA